MTTEETEWENMLKENKKLYDAERDAYEKCLCGHDLGLHKHADNCYGPACACTRFKEQPLP